MPPKIRGRPITAKVIIIELHDRMEEGCAKAFFSAINKCYTKYSYSTLGENVIITNLDKL